MKAEIIAPQGFRIAPEGHTVLTFKMGDVVTGAIAEEAILSGSAKRMDEIAESLERKTETQQEPEQVRRRGRPRKVQE